jgi:subtilisin-like proprotein convertase family protein
MFFKSMKYAAALLLLVVLALIAACGGGDGGNAGGTTYDPSSSSPPPVHTYQVTAGNTYTFRADSSAGDFWFLVYDSYPFADPVPLPIGFSIVYEGEYDNYSFVATSNQTLYVTTAPTTTSPYTYSLQTSTNHLTVDAAAVSGSTMDSSLYYSFDAQAGKSYEVYLSPSTGNVNIGAVSANTDMSASLGSSSRSGTQTDRVGFTASVTGRHYVRVSPTSTDSAFTIGVREIGTEPDLEVVITSANSDGINLNISYTVYNNGLTDSGPFQVDAWSNLASAPVVGSTGDASRSHVSIPAYGSASASFAIAEPAASGTAYMTVDSTSSVTESDETNNVTAGEAWVATEPDLQVSITGVYSDGANVKINYRVDNNGSRNAGAFAIDFWANPASAPAVGDYGDASAGHSSLYAGSYTTGSVTIANTDMAGTAYAIVDTVNTVNESDETNNVSAGSAWTISYPDLSVVIDKVSSNGAEVIIDYTVTNGPDNYAGAFNVDFWTDAAGPPAVGTSGEASASHAGGLSPGGSVSGSVTIASTLAAGTAYAVVDTANAVTETSEANNVSPGSAWTASYPDLQVVVERVIADGSQAKIRIEVYNKGAGNAGSFDVELWPDLASAPTVGDVGTQTVSFDFSSYPLPPGAFTSKTVTVPTTLATGTAYAIVDTAGALPESDETNNVSVANAWALTYFSPDVSHASPITVPDNDTVTGASASITLSGMTTSINKVVVGLNVWHDSPADIDIYLESPSGTIIELTTDNAACGAGDYGDSVMDTLFDDDASESVLYPSDCFYNGIYRPEQPLGNLAGEDANGTWILHVYDDQAGTTGTFRKFSLSIK